MDRELRKLAATCAGYIRDLRMGAKEVIRMEMGYLISDLANALGPKDTAHIKREIQKERLKVFEPIGQEWNLKNATKHGAGDFVWLAAGPRFLVGVDKVHYLPKATEQDMSAVFKASHGREHGKRRLYRALRGRQAVYELNRFVVPRAAFMRFMKAAQDRIGRLRASFYASHYILKPKGRKPPGWVMRHLLTGNAGGTYLDATTDDVNPSFTIISKARGCESKHARETIFKVLRVRVMKAEKRLAYLCRKPKEKQQPE